VAVIDFMIEHPVKAGALCAVLILQAWAVHRLSRIARQIPASGAQVIAFPRGDAA
jgi:hypothetical protein